MPPMNTLIAQSSPFRDFGDISSGTCFARGPGSSRTGGARDLEPWPMAPGRLDDEAPLDAGGRMSGKRAGSEGIGNGTVKHRSELRAAGLEAGQGRHRRAGASSAKDTQTPRRKAVEAQSG
jgi:hypothetical protein